MGNPVGVGMLSHHHPGECVPPAGGHSAGSATRLCLGLWHQETGSEGHVIGSHKAVICFWSVVSKW